MELYYYTNDEIKDIFSVSDSSIYRYEKRNYFKSIKIDEEGNKLYALPDYFDTDVFKTFKDASEILNIPLKTIYKWTTLKKIKTYSFFGKKFLEIKELKDFFQNNKYKIINWKSKCDIWTGIYY